MTPSTQSTIVAVYKNVSDAQAAAGELKRNGFNEDEIFIGSTSQTSVGRSEPSHSGEGGISGWFKRVFGEEHNEDRSYYENATTSGNVVLSVDVANGNTERVAEVLNRYSPIDIHREGSTSAAGATGTTAATASRSGDSGVIPVVDEELKVGKRSVLRGGVRIYSRTVEQPVEETLRLQEEHVRVDRQRVDRPATQAELRAGQEQVIEVQEYAEEPVVSKQARVVEEIRVGKETTEREQTIRDNVRHTEVGYENLGSSQNPELDRDFRRDFESRYGTTGVDYNTYGPAYNYGYQMASEPRYSGRSFDDVEPDLRSDYGRRYPNQTWEKMKDSIRYGWDRLTERKSSATGGR
jgi:uncharacterized protein (TIGR02271 family)